MGRRRTRPRLLERRNKQCRARGRDLMLALGLLIRYAPAEHPSPGWADAGVELDELARGESDHEPAREVGGGARGRPVG